MSSSNPNNGTPSDSSRSVRFNDVVTEHNYTPQQTQSQMDSDARLAEALQRTELSGQGGPGGGRPGGPGGGGQMSQLLELSGPPGMGRGGISGVSSGQFSRTSYMTTRTQSPYGDMGGGVSTMYSRSSFGGYGMRREPGPDEEWYSYVSNFSGNTRWKIRKKEKPPESSLQQGGSAGQMGGGGYQDLLGQRPGMPGSMGPRMGMPGSMGPGMGMPGMTGMPGSMGPGMRMPGMAGMPGSMGPRMGMPGSMGPGMGMPGMTGMPGSMGPGMGMPGMAGMPGAMGQGRGRGMAGMPGAMYGSPAGTGGRGRGQGGDAILRLIEAEQVKAQSCTDSLALGASTFIILDASASMQGEPYKEAVEAIERFLSGLDENAMEHGLEENIGLITFGSEDQTGVVQHMTNDFSKIREAMGRVRPRGMSSISTALIYILGLFGRVNGINLHGHIVNPRIIIVSDGNVAEGPDTGVDACMDQNQFLQISNVTMEIAQNLAEKSKIKMHFIPVGKPNGIIPEMLTGVTGGSVVLAGDAKWLSRSYIHHMVVGAILEQTRGIQVDRSAVEAAAKSKYSHLEDRDIDAIMNLLEEERRNQTAPRGGSSSHPGMQRMQEFESPLQTQVGPNTGFSGMSPMNSGGPVPLQAGPNTGFSGMSSMKTGGPVPSQAGPNTGFSGMSSMKTGGPVPSQADPNTGFSGMSPMNSGGPVPLQAGQNTGFSGMSSMKTGSPVPSQAGPNTGFSAMTPMNSGGPVPSQAGPNTGFPGMTPMNSGSPVPEKTAGTVTRESNVVGQTSALTNQKVDSGPSDKLPAQTKESEQLSSTTTTKDTTTTPGTNVGLEKQSSVTKKYTSSRYNRNTESEMSGSDCGYSQSEYETDDERRKGARPKRSRMKWNQLKPQPTVNQNQPKPEMRQEPKQELRQKPKHEPIHEINQDLKQEPKQEVRQEPNQNPNQEPKQKDTQEPNQNPNQEPKQKDTQEPNQDTNQKSKQELKQEPNQELMEEPKQKFTKESNQDPKNEPTSDPSMPAPQNQQNIVSSNTKNLQQSNSNVGQNKTSQGKGQGRPAAKNKPKWNVLSSSPSVNTEQSSGAGQNVSLQNTTGQSNTGQNNTGTSDTGPNRTGPNSHSSGQHDMQMSSHNETQNQQPLNLQDYKSGGLQSMADSSQTGGIQLGDQAGGQFSGQQWNPLGFQQNTQVYQPSDQAGGQFIGQQWNPLNMQQNMQQYQHSDQAGGQFTGQQWSPLDMQQNMQQYKPTDQADGRFTGQQWNPLGFQQSTQQAYLPSGQAGGDFTSQQWNPLGFQQNTQHAYQPLGQFSDPYADLETDLPPGASYGEQQHRPFVDGYDQNSIEQRLKRILEENEKNRNAKEAGDASEEEKEIVKVRRRRRKPKKDGKGYNQSLDITFGDISRQAEEAVGYGKPPKPEPSEEPEAAANAEQAVQEQTENKETEETPQRQGIKLEDLLRMQSRNNNNNGDGDGDGEGQGQQTLFPGMLGNQEKQQQSDEITEEKIKELLEKYGTGPPKTDNLPKMPRIGLRVTPGPDWMWNQNGIPLNAVGTVIAIDEEEEGWVRVRWDYYNIEEDYRYGLDYEFDIQPLEGGMAAVDWPPGRERIILEPDWLDELESDEYEDDDEEEAHEASCAQSEDDIKKEKSEEAPADDNTSGDQASSPEVPVKPDDLPPPGAGASGEQSPRETCFVWQYKDDENIWRTYPVEIQEKLEKTYIKRKGKGSAVIQMDGKTERVVFNVVNGLMEQRNSDRQTTRAVQRIEADAEKLRELQDMYSQS